MTALTQERWARPKAAAPTTGEPTTGEPTTGEPTTDEPKAAAPTTGEPTTGEPTTDEQDPVAQSRTDGPVAGTGRWLRLVEPSDAAADPVGPLASAEVPDRLARHRQPGPVTRAARVLAGVWRAVCRAVCRAGGALRRRAVGSRGWGACRASCDAGMATAEYAIVTVAAAAFAGLLIAILRSDEVRGLLLGIVRGALSV